MLAFICALVFSGALIVAAYCDAATMTIPNRLNIVFAIAFVALGPLALGWQGFAMHVGAGAAMLAVGVTFFALGWIGGGDAKLFAATALWIGWHDMAAYAAVTGVAGGVLTLGLMTLRNVPVVPAAAFDHAWVARLLRPKGDVPYGLALAAGGLVVFPQGAFMAAASAF